MSQGSTSHIWRTVVLVIVLVLLTQLEYSPLDFVTVTIEEVKSSAPKPRLGFLVEDDRGVGKGRASPPSQNVPGPTVHNENTEVKANNQERASSANGGDPEEEIPGQREEGGKSTPVAVCLIGQPRPRQEFWWHTMYQRALAPIRSDADVFFAFSNGNSFGTMKPDGTGLELGPRNLSYPRWLYKPKKEINFDSRTEGLKNDDGLTIYYNGRKTIGSGCYQSMANEKCLAMIRESEKARGEPYEYVLKFRPDLIFHGVFPPYSKWPKRSTITKPTVWVPNLNACDTKVGDGSPEANACVNDHLAVMTNGRAAEAYLHGSFEDFILYANASSGAIGVCPECLFGRLLSVRGVHKKVIGNYHPWILNRALNPFEWKEFDPQIASIGGGSPLFPELGKCENQSCIDASCHNGKLRLKPMEQVCEAVMARPTEMVIE